MLIFHQKIARGAPRMALGRQRILKIYRSGAQGLEGVPEMPTKGISQNSPYGDYFIYIPFQAALLFAEVNPELQVEAEEGDSAPAPLLEVKARRIAKDHSGQVLASGISRVTVDIAAVHVMFHLESGWQFSVISPKMIENAWRAVNFAVFRYNRPMVKVGGVAIRGTQTEAIHMNVRPLSGDIRGAAWPPVLMVEVPKGPLTPRPEVVALSYVMDHSALEGKICLKRCHRYFSLEDASKVGQPTCECDTRLQAEDHRRELIRERQRAPKVTAKQAIDRAFGELPPKSETPCKAYPKGLCRSTKAGVMCGFFHPVEPIPSEIECRLPRNKSGKCSNGEGCEYSHGPPARAPAAPPPAPAAAGSSTILPYAACQHFPT